MFLLGTLLSASAQVPSYVPSNGLIGWWPFSGNTNDESGNGYNGTVTGATLTTDRFGNANSSYNFNGTSSKIGFGSSQSLINLSVFTYSVWLYRDPLCKYGAIVISNYGGNYRGNLLFGKVDGNGYAQIRLHKLSSFAGSESSILDNTWTNIVTVKDANSVKIFKDGVLIQNSDITNFTSLNNTSFPFVVGGSGWGNSNYFMGNIDDIGIWNRALTQTEITNLYNANLCYQTITVTDTLVINVKRASLNPLAYTNTIKVYPNPTNDKITIDNGDLSKMTGYSIKIYNSIGQQLFQSNITQQQFSLDITQWGGNGLYFMELKDNNGNIVDIKKIVLQ